MRGAQLGRSLEQQAGRGVVAQGVQVMPGGQSLDAAGVVTEQGVQPQGLALVWQQAVQLGAVHCVRRN